MTAVLFVLFFVAVIGAFLAFGCAPEHRTDGKRCRACEDVR